MANRRMISKSISISRKVNSISDFGALLFTWMIPHADDYGVLDGDEGTIKALVVPRRKQTESAVGQALAEMQKVGLIWRYFYKNKPYIQFINFEEHQEGLHKRTSPKLPLYLDCRDDIDNFTEIPGNSPLIEQNLIEPNRREQNSPKGNEVVYDYFSDFWEVYPKKVAKADAVKAFAKLKINNELMKMVMAGLKRAIKSDAWQKDDGKFVPYPATWINGRRWEDGK